MTQHHDEDQTIAPTQQTVSPQYNAAHIEQQIIDGWKANQTFEKSITTR
jgi:hypothetical protein